MSSPGITIGPGISIGGGIDVGSGVQRFNNGNSSLQFSNTGDVKITDSNRLSIGAGGSTMWTIEGFFYFNSIQNSDSYFGKYNNINSEYIFWAASGGQRGFRTYLSDGQTPQIDCAFNNPSANAWHHIAFVRYVSAFNVYVDGVSVYSQTVSTTTNTNSGTPFELGYNANFNVSNFRITNTPVYTGNFPVPTAPLGYTQSADYAHNINGIVGTQVTLLLNTYTATPLLDGSGYYGNVPVNGTIAYSSNAPF